MREREREREKVEKLTEEIRVVVLLKRERAIEYMMLIVNNVLEFEIKTKPWSLHFISKV